MTACAHFSVARLSTGWRCTGCPLTFTPDVPQTYGHLAGRQRAIVEAIADYWQRHGIAPTIREIADATGLDSTSTVQHHVNRLVARGHLLRTPGAQRSLRLPTGS